MWELSPQYKEAAKKAIGIPNIIILTQTEYDALPETKNTDGVLYLIKE